MDRLFKYKTIIIFFGLFFQLYNNQYFSGQKVGSDNYDKGYKFRIK